MNWKQKICLSKTHNVELKKKKNLLQKLITNAKVNNKELKWMNVTTHIHEFVISKRICFKINWNTNSYNTCATKLIRDLFYLIKIHNIAHLKGIWEFC